MTVDEATLALDEGDALSVDDDAVKDATVPHISYDITSYGADYDVEGLVRRLARDEIYVPHFQRHYVWKQPEASRFIESLLLGLPVPGIFLAREAETNRFLVIDGQQRLKTLQYFYEGVFAPREGEKKQRVFELMGVQPEFEGRTYATLDGPHRLRLDNAILHATVVRQDSPDDNDTSIFHIFERLNSAGRVLSPQEMRVALYHGPLIDRVRDLNQLTEWREIFGKTNPRLKDEELILRFLALFLESEHYQRPMAEFLNRFSSEYRDADDEALERMAAAFEGTVRTFHKSLGREAFRPGRTLNAAIFDSAMVGLARRLESGLPIAEATVAELYRELIADKAYAEATSRSTSDDAFVRQRLQRATEFFARQ
jgi:hypothetical protein